MDDAEQEKFRERLWVLMYHIPEGCVCTYGQLAALAGHPAHARLVGRIVSLLPPGSKLPWHRLLNASGRLTSPSAEEQAMRLRAEGVIVRGGKVDLRKYRWQTD